MKTKTIFCLLIVLFVVLNTNAQERGPVAVSPSSDVGIASVGESCPTFSWTSVEWAVAYKVVVFETSGPNVLAYNEMEVIASPILRKEIRGHALSWTPSSDEGLGPGEMYVWYVQAIDAYGQGVWSEGRIFRILAGLRYEAVEERISKRLKKQGVKDEVIEDVLEDLMLGMGEVIAYGTPSKDVVDDKNLVGIQTIEGETSDNTYFGLGAGDFLSSGYSNTFIGRDAGYWNTGGFCNTFVGHEAGYNTSEYFTSSGRFNTFIGENTGYGNLTGSSNTFIGSRAGYNNQTGSFNVFIGTYAGYNETGSEKLYIENGITNRPLIWGDFFYDILTVHGKLGIGTKSPAYQMEVETTGENAILLLDRTDGATTGFSASGDKCAFGTLSNHPLYCVIAGAFTMILHTNGSLEMSNGARCTAAGVWRDVSSREYKENILELSADEAMDALEELNPVRYNYKKDKKEEYVGFIAEDVPDLVASNDRKTMSPMDVVAVLTKVVQEQQKMAEKQQKTIDELQKKIDELERKSK